MTYIIKYNKNNKRVRKNGVLTPAMEYPEQARKWIDKHLGGSKYVGFCSSNENISKDNCMICQLERENTELRNKVKEIMSLPSRGHYYNKDGSMYDGDDNLILMQDILDVLHNSKD